MDRRTFIASNLAASAVLLGGCPAPANVSDPAHEPIDVEFSDIPNFCSHEHWGSISSIGHAPEGFKADVVAGTTPHRKTTLLDLIIDPYFSGCLGPARREVDAAVRKELGLDLFAAAAKKPAETMRIIRPMLRPHRMVGTYQCTRLGILRAYGFDINSDDAQAAAKANKAVGDNYDDIFGWYRRAMKKFNFSELIRPVHPEFYARKQSEQSAQEELAFTNTIMRIDPFMALWKKKSPRRDGLAEIAGVEPRDAKTWRKFLDRIFEISAEQKNTGIKQLQAYSRPLLFDRPDDSAVRFIGDLTPDQVRTFQDWVMHECCKRANDRNWPHQVHVGTHNLPDSNPLPLQSLARRYPNQKIVMLHCWPYLDESGYLAKYFPNIHIDTCWQPILNPEFLRKALRQWLTYVPTSKIMMANDATSIEMAAGASHFSRTILAETLKKLSPTAAITPNHQHQIAANLLHNNATRMYKIGHAYTTGRHKI